MVYAFSLSLFFLFLSSHSPSLSFSLFSGEPCHTPRGFPIICFGFLHELCLILAWLFYFITIFFAFSITHHHPFMHPSVHTYTDQYIHPFLRPSAHPPPKTHRGGGGIPSTLVPLPWPGGGGRVPVRPGTYIYIRRPL